MPFEKSILWLNKAVNIYILVDIKSHYKSSSWLSKEKMGQIGDGTDSRSPLPKGNVTLAVGRSALGC